MIADVRQMLDATVVMLLGIARDTQSDSLRHLLLGGGENEAGARKRELGGLEDLRHFIERESASAQDETTEFALRMQEDREALGSSKLFGACGKRALNFTEHERGVCVCVCVCGAKNTVSVHPIPMQIRARAGVFSGVGTCPLRIPVRL